LLGARKLLKAGLKQWEGHPPDTWVPWLSALLSQGWELPTHRLQSWTPCRLIAHKQSCAVSTPGKPAVDRRQISSYAGVQGEGGRDLAAVGPQLEPPGSTELQSSPLSKCVTWHLVLPEA
jgi:hypothetical protein